MPDSSDGSIAAFPCADCRDDAFALEAIDALADAAAVDDALRRWSEAQLQVAAQVMPIAERTERNLMFDMPDLSAMPTAATNDWMAAAHPGYAVTLPDV